ncbi:MAG: MFS transporter [Deltaproteobacteria bacterium]|nr:MFS transporter [Deltaproteobacteria bacterium]
MSEKESNINFKIIWALTLIHFSGDFFSSFVTPLLPVFGDKFALTLTQIGFIAGLGRFLSFIVQPMVGYMADRYRNRIFILGGPLLTTLCIPLTGIAPSFGVLLVFIALGSIGSSMFHPATAGMVPSYSGSKLGFSMSLFNTGGTFAFGVGPLFIAWYVASFGLEQMPWTAVAGLLLLVYLFFIVPSPEGEGLRNYGFLGSIKETFGAVWRSIIVIWLLMVLRAFVAHSFRTFVPVLFANEGFSLMSIGVIVAVFTVAGTLSGLFTGYVSDKIGYKKIFYCAHALTTVFLILFLVVPGLWAYVMAALAGASAMATLPLGVTMAQKLAPRGRSMVSSLMMGFAFGLGGVMAPAVGALADFFSIRAVLAVIALIPLFSMIFISRLPEKQLTQ